MRIGGKLYVLPRFQQVDFIGSLLQEMLHEVVLRVNVRVAQVVVDA